MTTNTSLALTSHTFALHTTWSLMTRILASTPSPWLDNHQHMMIAFISGSWLDAHQHMMTSSIPSLDMHQHMMHSSLALHQPMMDLLFDMMINSWSSPLFELDMHQHTMHPLLQALLFNIINPWWSSSSWTSSTHDDFFFFKDLDLMTINSWCHQKSSTT